MKVNLLEKKYIMHPKAKCKWFLDFSLFYVTYAQERLVANTNS